MAEAENGQSPSEPPAPAGLTDRQAELILTTWDMVKEVGLQTAGTIMFIKLFEISPALQDLFPFKGTEVTEDNEGMKKHGLQVMESIDGAIETLKQGNLDNLTEDLTTLGIIHNMQGVQVDSFAPVGAALLYTLEKGLGEKFTDEVKGSWVALYGIVQHYMTLGMNEGLDA